MTYKIAAMYRFVSLTDLPRLQAELKSSLLWHNISGTILIAPEGVNGTIAGLPDDLDQAVAILDKAVGISQGELKYSQAEIKPFGKLRVRIKKEIITMRRPEADPTVQTGIYVDASEWNNLISDPKTLLLDTRNTYETELGVFKGAVDPQVETFSAFADWIDANLDPEKHENVAVYCTGGIRDEKASSYLLHKGFKNVYQLKGGILKYLETVPKEQSLWEGSCFVFDRRVGVQHGLAEDLAAQQAVREASTRELR